MKVYITIVLFLISSVLFSQSKISGIVIDSHGNRIAGANVIELGTSNGANSNSNGEFLINSLNDTTSFFISNMFWNSDTIKVYADTNLVVKLCHDNSCIISYSKKTRFMVGAQYDFVNNMFGISYSNAYDERPIIHFEDFFDRFIYKFYGSTNFKSDYTIGADLGLKLPLWYIYFIGIGFRQDDYLQKRVFFREVYFSSEANLGRIGLSLILKFAYNTFNENNNFGVNLEARKNIFNNRLYTGLSIGYYSKYFTYSALIHGFIIKDKISLGLKFEKINRTNFLKLGVNYTLNK